MTIYICKCGRRVSKSTNADNTGNRDTENCKGCPYLLPWGPMEWTGKSFEQNVQGHECRMSPEISYATDYSGNADDKCALKIHSLDLDFLEEVQAWIDEYADDQLSGRFSRDTIRGTDYCNKGRYSWSISCAQNKKGMAAKAALIERFFGPDGHRLDKTPKEEKAIVLAVIEAGKAKAQERKENMDYIIGKHVATGRLYAYYKGSFWFWDSHVKKWLRSQFAEDLYQEECPKRWNFEREHLLTQTSDFHQLDDYEVSSDCIEALLQCNPKTAIPAPASAESPEIVDECSESNCTCSDCKRQDCTCAGGCDVGDRGKCDGEKNCAQDGCTYTAKHQENPIPAAPVSPVDAGAATQSQSAAEPVSLEADLPDVCQSCQCVTCGNEDCTTPCFQRDDEVQECKKLGPMGDACEYYQSKEDAQCQKEDAPSADAAATSDGSAARMCEGPDEETQTTPAAASGAALESLHAQSALPQNAPAQDIAADAPSALGFDFGADVATNAELLQCAQTFVMGRVAQVMAAKKAHDITANHYQGSWGKWCQAVGISRDTGDNYVRVAENFGNIELNGKPIIEVTPISLLALGAKPSTPDVLTEGIGRGEITTIKQFRELEAQLKAVQTERDEARKAKEKAEQERDAARDAQANLSAMANKFSKQRDAAEQRVEDAERRAEEAHKAANTYHCQYEEANAQKNALLDKQGAYIYQVAAAEQRAEEAERRARAAEEDAAGWKQAGLEMQELVDQRDERIRELESGITVEAAAVDQEEIERRANELSEPLVKIIDQQNEQIERMASGNTVSAQASVLEQYLETMKASLLSNARRTELACYDVGALDSLAQALRAFADEIDGLFEEGGENEE